jgi:hypothetical protein
LLIAHNPHNIGCCKLASVERPVQISLDGGGQSGRVVADRLSDSLGKLTGKWRRGQECLELLLFGWGKVSPDGGSICITVLTDFDQYIFNVESCLSIVAGNGSADKFQTFNVGGWVEFWGGRSILLVVF